MKIKSFLSSHKRGITRTTLILFSIWLLSHFFPYVLIPTLSLWGREAILETPQGLSYVSYGFLNLKTITPIPSSQNHLSVAILDDHTVVWSSSATSTNTFSINTWKGTTTNTVLTLPILDLPTYALDYEKHTTTLQPKDVSNFTNPVYRDSFIVFPNNTVGWLDFIPTKGDGKVITDVSMRLRKFNINTNTLTEMEVMTFGEYAKGSRVFDEVYLTEKGGTELRRPIEKPFYLYPEGYSLKSGIFYGFFAGKNAIADVGYGYGNGVAYYDSYSIIFRGVKRISEKNNSSADAVLTCSLEKPNSCEISEKDGYGLIFNPTTLASVQVAKFSHEVVCIVDCHGFYSTFIQTMNGDSVRRFHPVIAIAQDSEGHLRLNGLSTDHSLAFVEVPIDVQYDEGGRYYSFAITPILGRTAKLHEGVNERVVYLR